MAELGKYTIEFPNTDTLETQNRTPNVHYRIFYGVHGSKRDLEGFERQFSSCDIFIPEGVGWGEREVRLCSQLSSGAIDPQSAEASYGEAMNNSQMQGYFRGLFETIHNSNKHITFIDIPYDKVQGDQGENNNDPYSKDKSFTEIMEQVKRDAKVFADKDIVEREAYMLSQLKESIRQIIANDPNLQQKINNNEEVNVLFFLGKLHTGIFHALHRDGQNVTKIFNKSPVLYTNQDILERSFAFGREVNNEIVARAYLEKRVEAYFYRGNGYDINRDNEKLYRFFKKVADSFTFEEIAEMYKQFQLNKKPFWSILMDQGKDIPDITFKHTDSASVRMNSDETEEVIDNFLENSK